MNQLSIDGVEPMQVTDEFIVENICKCLIGKTRFAFGEPAEKWERLIQDAQLMDRAKIYCHAIKLQTVPYQAQSVAREAVIEYARELIDIAIANGWDDQLEEWGVRQKEVI